MFLRISPWLWFSEHHHNAWTLSIDGFKLLFSDATMVAGSSFDWKDVEFSKDKYGHSQVTLELRIEESANNQ